MREWESSSENDFPETAPVLLWEIAKAVFKCSHVAKSSHFQAWRSFGKISKRRMFWISHRNEYMSK